MRRCVFRIARGARAIADDAVEGGGYAHRAAGVGADGKRHNPGRDRNRRAARHARAAVERAVHRRAEVRVEAEAGKGELGEVGFADADNAGAGGVGDEPSVGVRGDVLLVDRGRPAISNRSFHATGTPSSELKGAPLFQRAADCAASACARSGVRTMNASGTLVARSSAHSVTLTGWAQPSA